jgi:sortase (surface protein transpeptidase)
VKKGLALSGLVLSVAIGVAGTAVLFGAPMMVEAPAAGTHVQIAASPQPAPVPSDDRTVPSDTPRAALLQGTRIVVPRLHIDLPLENGVAERDVAAQSTPSGAAFLLPGSAVPGTSGNSYVYAHARPGMFLALWNVAIGDHIDIVGPTGGVLSYTVFEIDPHVAVTDLRFLVPTEDDRLTLQTSTGPTVSDPRFVVVARPTVP